MIYKSKHLIATFNPRPLMIHLFSRATSVTILYRQTDRHNLLLKMDQVIRTIILPTDTSRCNWWCRLPQYIYSFRNLHSNTPGTAGGPGGRDLKKQENGRKKHLFFLKKYINIINKFKI